MESRTFTLVILLICVSKRCHTVDMCSKRCPAEKRTPITAPLIISTGIPTHLRTGSRVLSYNQIIMDLVREGKILHHDNMSHMGASDTCVPTPSVSVQFDF